MMRTVLLGDIVRIRRGASPRPIQDYIQSTPGIPWVKIADATSANSRFINSTKEYIKEDGRRKSVEVSPGTLILSNSATPGLPMIMKIEACVHDGWLVLDELKGVDRDWLYYFLLNRREISAKAASGSVFSNLKTDIVRRFEVLLPPIDQQKKIADILSSLDEKIELNRRMNETLEQLGQALFRHYFIDNPDAKNWKKRSLGEFFPVKTGKKDANFGTKDGKFPFFTCAQTISRAPSYSFDGSAILVAGNGDFNIKYYTGKFEAYQRTYVLIPHNEELLGFLYFLMKKDLSLITGGSRGSVIKFITKGMIENYRVELPDDNDIAAFAPIFSELLDLISHSNEQIQTLAALRDALLPNLISGEIEI